MSKTHLTEIKFSELGLEPKLLSGLEAKGFHNCTPIQAETLPLLLNGKNIAGQAQTGTGKTIAFFRITSYNVCYTKLLRLWLNVLRSYY